MVTLFLLCRVALAGDPMTPAHDAFRADDLAGALELAREGLQEVKASESDEVMVARAENFLGVVLLALGHLDPALIQFEGVVATRKRLLGPDHLETARAIGNVANVRDNQGEYLEQLALLEEQIPILLRELAPDNSEVLRAQSAAAHARYRSGDLRGATVALEGVVSVLQAVPGPRPAELARHQKDLADMYLNSDRLEEARALLEEAVPTLEAELGPGHRTVAMAYNSLAEVAKADGDHELAISRYEKSISIWKESDGDDTPRQVAPLLNLAFAHLNLGRYELAKAAYDRSLQLVLNGWGPDHPWVGVVHANLGMLANRRGDFQGARHYLELALEREIPDTPEAAKIQVNLATTFESIGDPVRARALLEGSLKIFEDRLGPDHPAVATTLHNLASHRSALGDRDAALALYERVMEIRNRSENPNDLQKLRTLENIGGIYRAQNRYDDAWRQFEYVLEERIRILDPNHRDIALVLTHLARVSEEERSRELLHQAVEVMERGVGEQDADLPTTLYFLGKSYLEAGDLVGARAHFQRSLDLIETHRGPGHPKSASTLASLATLERLDGHPERARERANLALDIATKQLSDVVGSVGEREALAAVAKQRAILDRFLIETVDSDDGHQAWVRVLEGKGMASRALRHRQDRLVLADDDSLAPVLDALADTRRLIARTVWSDAEDAATEIAALTQEKEDLERQLATSESWSQQRERDHAQPEGICAALSNRSALVDFIRYDDRYVAFAVVAGQCEVHRIELGDATPIDDAITAWREVLVSSRGGDTSRIDRRGAEVYDLIWRPLAPLLEEAKEILLVPDSSLAALPFAALPASDGYLVEAHVLRYVEHAADLLRPHLAGSEGALVVGGVDYGEPGAADDQEACVGRSFTALPGAERETDEVTRRLENRRSDVEVLAGGQATETAVLDQMPRKRVIHMATHGFFATGSCQTLTSGSDGLAASQAVGFNPMVLSGLVLAGANVRNPLELDDGLLTAEELSGLDLRGTELVVLSACETGLGEVRSGEGVLGLRRAFVVSGVQNLVMSMWGIDDETTARLMNRFYQRLGKRQQRDPAVALRDAQLTLISEARRAWGEARPNLWGAWIAAGG